MAVIANFDTTILEGLASALYTAEGALDEAITELAAAQAAEDTAEVGLNDSVSHAIDVLTAPTSEFAVADRLERGLAAQQAALSSGTIGLPAASTIVTTAMAALVTAQTDKNTALNALANYLAVLAGN